MKIKAIVISFLLISFYCCSPSAYKPTLADVNHGKNKYPDITLEQLNSGMDLYANKCGSCHLLYKPFEITEERWTKVLPDMKKEAKLSDKEYDLICKYVYSKTKKLDNTKYDSNSR